MVKDKVINALQKASFSASNVRESGSKFKKIEIQKFHRSYIFVCFLLNCI